MKLTSKDKDFIEKLKALIAEKGLWIDTRSGPYHYFVLRGNYGDKVEKEFGMSRQGVRWRFHRLMEMYISAIETVYFVEKNMGSNLRQPAMDMAQERYLLRLKAKQVNFEEANKLDTANEDAS